MPLVLVVVLLIALAVSIVVPVGLFAVTYAISTAAKTKRALERERAARSTPEVAPPLPLEAQSAGDGGAPYRNAAPPAPLDKAPFPLAGVGLAVSIGSLFLGLPLLGGGSDDYSSFVPVILGVSTLGGILGAAALGQRRSGMSWGAMVVGLLPWGTVGLKTILSGFGAPGRPIRVRGIPRLPRTRRRRGAPLPRAYQPRVVGVAPAAREELARLWEEDGRAEHASVPAFEHLANDLTLAGAPEPLVLRARQAATDEVGHAAMCFGLASAYAGCCIEASSEAFAPRWTAPEGTRSALVERLAVESLVDGCVGEGAAASEAWGASQRATDPVVLEVLSRIAIEEESHAELAWSVVRWALETDATLSMPLARAIERMHASQPHQGARPRPPGSGLEEHGRLSREARSQAWQSALAAAAARLASLADQRER